MSENVKKSRSVWKAGAAFEHQAEQGVTYFTDALLGGDPPRGLLGPTPMDALLGALPGCAGVDMVSILKRMRFEPRSLEIMVTAERASAHPRIFTSLHLDIKLATEPVHTAKVLRAVRLATGKYCSVSAMLAHSAEITYTLHYAGQEHAGRVDGHRGG